MNSLKAYAAGIRPSGNLGEAGLTNPSHGSATPPPESGVYTDTKLLKLTRFQVISPPPHSRSRQEKTGSGLKPPSGVRTNCKTVTKKKNKKKKGFLHLLVLVLSCNKKNSRSPFFFTTINLNFQVDLNGDLYPDFSVSKHGFQVHLGLL